MTRWLGVDVGATRKGFDIALIDERRLETLAGRLSSAAVAAIVHATRPAVVAIDAPRSCAPPGRTARDCERQLNAAICGIRWTPDDVRVRGSSYYAWIVEGLALFDALAGADVVLLEVFPTASWTRWIGPRAMQSRAGWTRRGLITLDLAGVPDQTNQDQRDAIAAAVTARQFSHGTTETIGEIVVPR